MSSCNEKSGGAEGDGNEEVLTDVKIGDDEDPRG